MLCRAVLYCFWFIGLLQYRKSDINLGACDAGTTFSTYQRSEWMLAKGYNCWPGVRFLSVVFFWPTRPWPHMLAASVATLAGWLVLMCCFVLCRAAAWSE
jgi:hypothetical protein